MHRREFMTQSLAASAAALSASTAFAAPAATPKRPYFELRRYALTAGGPSGKLSDAYFADALVPALNRLGIPQVGAFKLDVGPDTPTVYLLIPSMSLETLANLNTLLAKDAAYLKAAELFLAAPADHPAYHRIDSTLLTAFDDFAVPAQTKRIFQLRIYESPTEQAHENKVAMFANAEIGIFRSVGMTPVFFAKALIGPNLPNLTYMLVFENQADLEAKWAAFGASPAWKKLVAMPGNGDDSLIRQITNLILSPKSYSQI
jgi:hypothetical protein